MDLHNKSLSAVLNNLSDAFMVINANGKIEFINAVAEKITGYTTVQARGMRCNELFKSDTCRTDCFFRYHSGTNRVCNKREMVLHQKNGSPKLVECTTSTIIDTDGTVTGAVDVFKDISKIKMLKENLKDSEYKYRRLFESTKDMIFITSQNGRLIDFNQSLVELLGYKSEQDLYDLEYLENIFISKIHWEVFQREITKNGFVKDFEAGFKTKDGDRLHCFLSANAVRDSKDNIVGFEGIAKDITARMDAFRSLYKQHQELLLLNTVAVTMNSALKLETVLSTALNEIMKLLSFSIGAIFLINHEKKKFEIKAQKGFRRHIFIENSENLTFYDKDLEEFLLGPDNYVTPKSIFPSFRVRINISRLRKTITLTCFLITEKEKPSGFMAFWIKNEEDLAIEDFHLLGSLGNFVGGAIANINLIKTVQKHREELKRVTAQLFESQEAECKRISRELHDETGSSLISINLKLDAVENKLPKSIQESRDLLRNIKGQINDTYMEMRRISHRLHPALLTDLGLEPALYQYITDISTQTDLIISFKMIGFTERINPDIETVLYRFSQETLSNTLKHANARSFKLSIIKGYPSIIFVAEDDGIGFDYDMDQKDRPSLGLLSMRERAMTWGGKFMLRTAPGDGTRVRIEIPLVERDTSRLECLEKQL